MDGDLDRALRFMATMEDALATRRLDLPFGTALFNDGLPRVWYQNFVRVERDAPLAEVLADTERVMAAADLDHRKVEVRLDELGARYAPESPWDVSRLVVMEHRGEPPPLDVRAEEVDGHALIESDAIMWYLATGTPLLPTAPADQADVLRWLIYEQTDVMPMIGGLRFRLLTRRFAPDSEEAEKRRRGACEALQVIDRHLADREFLAAGRYTIADMAIYGYAHVAHEAALDTEPYLSFRGWLDRVAAQPGFVDDLEPYPPNASLQVGRSTYG